MTDLSLKQKAQPERFEPEEIAVAILALIIWIPLAFLIGGAL